MKTITNEYLHEHKTVNGGWTSKQLSILGVDWPPKNRWIDEVCGMNISDTEANAFEEAKFEYKRKKKLRVKE